MPSTLAPVAMTSNTDDVNPRTLPDPRTQRLQQVWSAAGTRARAAATPSRCCGAGQHARSPVSVQRLTLFLDGITAGDYLSWVRDPEPLALDRDLRSVTVSADPLGDRIEIELIWDREPPAPWSALVAAGFPRVPEVVELATGRPSVRGPGSGTKLAVNASPDH